MGALLAYSFGVSFSLPRLFTGLEDESAAVRSAASVLGYLVVAFGAGIGGAIAQLWKTAALGVAFGFSTLVALLLLVGGTAFGHTAPSYVLLAAVALVASALGYLLAKKNAERASVGATSLLGALLIVCAFDLGGAQALLLQDLTALCTFDWAAIGRCGPNGSLACHGVKPFLVWVGLVGLAIVVQSYTGHDAFHIKQIVDAYILRRDRHPYAAVPGTCS